MPKKHFIMQIFPKSFDITLFYNLKNLLNLYFVGIMCFTMSGINILY